MSTSYWLDRSKQTQKRTFDVVIIGAGISGLSTAYWLNQKDPNLSIAVLDKGKLGSGATGKNAGFVTCGSVEHFNRMIGKLGMSGALEKWRYSEKNLELLQEHIVQDSGAEIEFEQNGSFSLGSTEKELEELTEVSKVMNENDIPIEVLNKADCQRRLGVEGFSGGIKYLKDATVHPIKLLDRICEKTKFTLFDRTEVIKVEKGDGDTRIVRTDNGTFETTLVVHALNGYGPAMDEFFADKVFATRGQILATEPVPRFMEGACYANFYLDYFRQLKDGTLVIGGFRQVEKDTEVGYSDHTTKRIQDSLEQFVRDHFPKLKSAKILYRWAGVMGFSADGIPYVGSLPSDNQVYFLGGYTAHGLGLAFHAGKNVSDLIFGEEIPDFISARRF